MRRLLVLVFILPLTLVCHALANNSVEQFVDRAYEQTTVGDLDAALKTLQQAVAEHPQSSLAYTRLGGVRMLRKEYSDGIKDFQQAIMLDQKNASAFIGMAVSYLHMNQYGLARATS